MKRSVATALTLLTLTGSLGLGACARSGTGSATTSTVATTPITAAGSSTSGSGSPTEATDGSTTPVTTSTSVAATGQGGSDKDITIALAGDANTAWVAQRALQVGIGPMSQYLRSADVAIVNLETLVAADRSGLVPLRKSFTFVTEEKFLQKFADAGVDVAPAANNHTMDFGVEGMRRMMAIQSPVPIIGVGLTDTQAFAPWETSVKGRKVVVFSANDVETDGYDWSARPDRPGQAVVMHPEGEDRLVAAVRKAHDADPSAVVVVYLHWGVEGTTCESGRQVRMAQRLADAGASVVAGTHAHRLMPYTTIKASDGREVAVHYGLGNFVFNTPSAASSRTGVLELTIPASMPASGAPQARWIPAKIVSGIPQPLEGARKEAELAEFAEGVSRCPAVG